MVVRECESAGGASGSKVELVLELFLVRMPEFNLIGWLRSLGTPGSRTTSFASSGGDHPTPPFLRARAYCIISQFSILMLVLRRHRHCRSRRRDVCLINCHLFDVSLREVDNDNSGERLRLGNQTGNGNANGYEYTEKRPQTSGPLVESLLLTVFLRTPSLEHIILSVLGVGMTIGSKTHQDTERRALLRRPRHS